MKQTSIVYKSIFMRCDHINKNAYLELPQSMEIISYHQGMEHTWAQIQKCAGEFSDRSVAQVSTFFMEQFGNDPSLSKRCFFLCEKASRICVGTCMSWYAYKQEKRIPLLHWLAVDNAYTGKGYARMLITHILKTFESLGESQGIYLHTQPSSYQAIKLYNDFGFSMTKKDCFDTKINEYEEAINVLKQYMTEQSYQKLLETSVL